MRGKGLVTFFSIALILICIYQLSFNFVTRRAESKATSYAETAVLNGKSLESVVAPNTANAALFKDSVQTEIRKKRQSYLDSISNKTIFNIGIAQFTYQECKDQQLNLGLDLQGGMNVVLQVSTEDLIRALADNSGDPTFNKALALAREKQKTQVQADFVTLFEQAWTEVAPEGKLASIFGTRDNQEKVKFNSTNQEVIAFIRAESNGAFDKTFNILRSRIDKFGVTQPNITAQASTGRITVELPGVDNPVRVRKLLQATAVLEFWETYDNPSFIQYLDAANTALRNKLTVTDTAAKAAATTENPLTTSGEVAVAANENPLLAEGSDSAGLTSLADSGLLTGDSLDIAAENAKNQAKENPLTSLLQPNIYRTADDKVALAPGPIIGYSLGKDTSKVNEYLSLDYIRSNFPKDVKFLWSAKATDEASNVYALYAIKMQVGTSKAPLEGDKVNDARQDIDQNGSPEVSMTMDNEGAKIWKVMTSKNIDKHIAIVLDNYVYSAPRVNGEIPNGRSSITGGFDINEAKDLANILTAGKLPAPARIIAEDVVGPSLGQESIQSGIISIVVAFIAILLFMVLYYNTSGIIADIALFFNVFFIIGVLASIGATLTLSGIAGIVLTMGMAVDANVLIHERIKEELARGKTLLKAVEEGHKKSYSAIFDSNITSLITGLILAYFGLGPVLGYATTLNIGIILTIFTAVFMGHIIFNFALKRNLPLRFTTRLSRNNFTNRNIPFVGKRKLGYLISGIVIVIMIASILLKGFTYGVDFTGGRSYTIRFDQDVNTTTIREDLAETLGGTPPVVKTYGPANQIKVTTGYLMENDNTMGSDSIVNQAIYAGLKKHLPENLSFKDYHADYQLRSEVIGPSISNDIRNSAFKAVIFGFLGIFLYIFFRFRKWQFATGTLIALAHDIIILMGIFSIFSGLLPFSLDLDETFIATVLTVMGYSVNDKVVVFDRVREFLREHLKGNTGVVINDALNNTLNRTIMTNVTVMIVLLILFIFGGEVIRGFVFGLIIGLIICTYSSIFIAAPLVVDLTKEKELKSFDTASGKQPKTPVAAK